MIRCTYGEQDYTSIAIKLAVVQFVTSQMQIYVVQHSSPLCIPISNILLSTIHTNTQIDSYDMIQFVYHLLANEVGTADNHC